MALRFVAAAALGDAVQRAGGRLPSGGPTRALRRLLYRPTFPAWNAAVEELGRVAAGLPGRPAPVVAALLAVWRDALGPLVGSGRGDPAAELAPLRDAIVHGRRGGAGDLRELAAGIRPRVIAALATLGRALRGSAVLRGPDGLTRLAGAEPSVPLEPICTYAAPGGGGMPPGETRVGAAGDRGPADTPLVYAREELSGALYTALAGPAPVVTAPCGLPALFPAEPADDAARADMDALLEDIAGERVGRDADLDRLFAHVADAPPVVAVTGPAGIGKTTLLAAFARDARFGPDGPLCLAHVFRAGHARCGIVPCLRALLAGLEREGRSPGAAGALATHGPTGGAPAAWLARVQTALDDVARRRPVVLVLDGVDELAAGDPDASAVLALLAGPRRTLVVSARTAAALAPLLALGGAAPVVTELPPMTPGDVRAMVLLGTDAARYAVLARDLSGSVPANPVVDAIVARSAGLPVYARLAVRDLAQGLIRPSTAEHDLPRSLTEYYDLQLRRLGISDAAHLARAVVEIVAGAGAVQRRRLPALLYAAGHLARPQESAALAAALDRVAAILRQTPGPDGPQLELLHPSLRTALGAPPPAAPLPDEPTA
jgi:hypothetical protein